MWQELLTILRKLGNDYSVVAALGKEKHKALVGVDMKTLDRLVKREADMAASIKKTESARQELCLKIIKSYPSITPDMKMQEAYQLAGPLARELKSAHESLSLLVEQVKNQAEINNILELRAVIRELVRIAGEQDGFVIRIHAGENDSLRDNVANSIACVTEALARDNYERCRARGERKGDFRAIGDAQTPKLQTSRPSRRGGAGPGIRAGEGVGGRLEGNGATGAQQLVIEACGIAVGGIAVPHIGVSRVHARYDHAMTRSISVPLGGVLAVVDEKHFLVGGCLEYVALTSGAGGV